MLLSRKIARTAVLAAATVAFLGCGGGGGGGTIVPTQPQPPPDPTWTTGVFSAPSTYAAYCAVPRTGTDPITSAAYPDKLGSTVWENHWLRAWTHSYYLWTTEVADVNPAGGYTTAQYFDLMKTTATTASGAAQDRFHFTYATNAWEQLETSNASIGYGVAWALIAAAPPRQLRIAYVDANTPATAASANLARGATVLSIDGVDLVNDNTTAGIATLNAGIAPSSVGESHTFVIEDTPGGAQRSVTLVAANITEDPVPKTATFAMPDGGTVGYVEFNSHVEPSESELVSAFTQFQTAGVTDLVLDIRYNGGGLLDIASEVAFMIAGPGPTTGVTFEKETFNDPNATVNPVTGEALTPTPFWSTTQGFSTTSGQALPHLNLARVFVLTTADTCSASEAIINGLRGVNINVIQVGSTTCGKPYGFYPQDNCGTTYFSIQFKGENAAGFGDYGDGFTPNNTASPPGVVIPGCSVGDDYDHQLGDTSEGLFAAALGYRTSGAAGCPAASGFAPTAVVAHLARPQVLMNRILRRTR
jgi:hypothetical protein